MVYVECNPPSLRVSVGNNLCSEEVESSYEITIFQIAITSLHNIGGNTMFKEKTLLITGGTGSFGNAVMKRFLNTDIKGNSNFFS